MQGWQPLHDTRAPVVRALPSAGMRGHGMVFRYRVSDDSGRGRVAISFTTPHGGAGFSDEGLRPLHAGVYRFRVPSLDFLHERLPNRFRFCVAASDPSGNSSRSCALFRFVRR